MLFRSKLIVSGGASLQSKENFNNIIVNFAHQIHAAVGATRAAVEAGLISNEHQVGQTGKKVAPDVYLAVGISGAVQHLSGMKNAKIVIAINCDKNATIFEYSDYGIIGDLFNIMPKLSNIIKTSKT